MPPLQESMNGCVIIIYYINMISNLSMEKNMDPFERCMLWFNMGMLHCCVKVCWSIFSQP